MTSSLVGSEMCIRDRISGVDLEHEEAVAEAASSGMPLITPSRQSGGKGCLLYTSDAADDM
eukprot:880528-Prorocentrum_lima.AAC.1